MKEPQVIHGDCRQEMQKLEASSIDAVVCDPPYHLTSIVERFGKEGAAPAKSDGPTGVYARASRGFMGQTWDGGDVAFRAETWREVLRVLKPGGYLLAFSGTRTYHRMTVAIEDAGFQIRDCFMWIYGSGFPKSLAVEKNVPPEHVEAWKGWGTALKPAWEPVVVARKPLEGTVAANVLKHGTGAMNIDGCRIESGGEHMVKGIVTKRTAVMGDERTASAAGMYAAGASFIPTNHPGGRWPANIILSHGPDCGEDGCVPGCPCAAMDAQSGVSKSTGGKFSGSNALGQDSGWNAHNNRPVEINRPADAGGASRYFNVLPIEADDLVPFVYAPKASRSEREAGCGELPARSGAEAVEREEESAGMQSPRAGAGRTASSVRNHHPTVKPIAVMRHLVRLVTPQGGTVLDPFTGSGTTGCAAALEGVGFIGFEQSAEYVEIARARIRHAMAKAKN